MKDETLFGFPVVMNPEMTNASLEGVQFGKLTPELAGQRRKERDNAPDS